ncbi:hypothetical protein FOTG_16997 [Fusarium oxysporum f. sp. vasinfectum 25433]|uniref:Uncharacterized protein n=1 Tax=Fusarium oxysporum f. sp. vasinfectum 25433 TaxID=1089449 RepID=X0KLV4_FUSOX|nr:hypothetical protein FOTG_16997 [Fusarium oxysporum f. sp. vasinfectum 25433]
MVEDRLYLLQQFGSPKEGGSTAMNECCLIPGPSAHPQYLVPPSDTQRPSLSDFDLPAIDMGELASSFSGIQRASWEATCAPDDDVSVPQPQHLSTNNNYPPSSERPIKKKRRRNGMQEAPRVVGQVGMPNPAPRPRRTIKKFAPEEVARLIELRKKKKADMEANRRRVSGAISRFIES